MSTPLRTLWAKWKALRLPWRRKYLCGTDLTGTTYWELAPALAISQRARRIARPPRGAHPSDLRLSPAWLQWLRHTRAEAPSLEEQEADLRRLEGLRARVAALEEGRVAERAALEQGEMGDAQVEQEEEHKRDPWRRARGTPGEEWQPQSWRPPRAAARG